MNAPDTRLKNKYFDSSDLKSYVQGYADEVFKLLKGVDVAALGQLITLLSETRAAHRTVWVAGNGGSSAIAEHLCCDWTKGIQHPEKPGMKVQSLCSVGPLMSAIANDLSYADVFSEQLKLLCEKGDVLFLISSSGNSANILKAAEAARAAGVKVVSFTGFSGGDVRRVSDINIYIPSSNYGTVEDVHQMLMHIVAQYTYLKELK